MSFVKLKWDFDGVQVASFYIFRDIKEIDISKLQNLKHLIVGKTKELSFEDNLIESNTEYYYVVAYLYNDVFLPSNQVTLTSGDVDVTALTWNPLDEIDVDMYITADEFTGDTFVAKGSQAVEFRKMGDATKSENNSIIFNKAYFTSVENYASEFMRGREDTTYFTLCKNIGPIGSGIFPLFFTGGDIQGGYPRTNAFCLFRQVDVRNTPQVWIRNTVGSSRWTNSRTLPTTVLNENVFHTMYAKWTEGLSGLQTLVRKQNFKVEQSNAKGSFHHPVLHRIEINYDTYSDKSSTELYCSLLINEKFTPELRVALEGWAAWKFNMVDELPEDHKFKHIAPKKGMYIDENI